MISPKGFYAKPEDPWVCDVIPYIKVKEPTLVTREVEPRMRNHHSSRAKTSPLEPFFGLVIDTSINETNCPTKYAVGVLAGKWKTVILYYLKGGPVRFGELKRLIPTASQKVLTQQLRALEKAQIVQRKVLEGPVKYVEYSYSALGLTLAPILISLAEWGEAHRSTKKTPDAK